MLLGQKAPFTYTLSPNCLLFRPYITLHCSDVTSLTCRISHIPIYVVFSFTHLIVMHIYIYFFFLYIYMCDLMKEITNIMCTEAAYMNKKHDHSPLT